MTKRRMTKTEKESDRIHKSLHMVIDMMLESGAPKGAVVGSLLVHAVTGSISCSLDAEETQKITRAKVHETVDRIWDKYEPAILKEHKTYLEESMS